jgi:type IV pilus assembly protein PilB
MSDAVLALLQSSELFGQAPAEWLARLIHASSSRALKTGTVLVEQGAQASHMFLVERGSVELRRRDPMIGRDHLYARYGAGKTVGEESVLCEEPWSTAAIAWEETVVWAMPAEAVRAIIQASPGVGGSAARILARRVNRLLAEKGVRYIPLGRLQPDVELARQLPARLLQDHRVLPIARRGATVTLAMVNPQDLLAIDEVQRLMPDVYLEIVSVSQAALDAWLRAHIGARAPGGVESVHTLAGRPQQAVLQQLPQRVQSIQFVQDTPEQSPDDPATNMSSGEQVISALNRILGDALSLDVSDIHIEPGPEHTQVRYRIDGQLVKRPDHIPSRLHAAIVSRLKALSNMDITERRKPQDGRLGLMHQGREISLRISTVRTRFGENVVMRILDRSNAVLGLERIVLVPHVRELIQKLFYLPHGIVFVTGPTGSGKTTTMYSAILERRNEGQNIVTIEDPIEYTIPGITQVAYNEKIDLGYAEAIKAFLRQDTDIMLIGETRDARTAANSMQAALSGHLVVTSIHTSSALGTIYRLQEMGIEPFLIANAVGGVVAQRLVRTVCSDCREPYTEDPAVLARLYRPGEEVPPLFRGAGCSRCNGTGFRGRTALVEVLPVSEELRTGIALGRPMNELRAMALKAGMVTFHDYARMVLARGLSTPSEVMRVLYSDSDEMLFAAASHVRCNACGAQNPADHRFCQECGATLDTRAAAPSA